MCVALSACAADLPNPIIWWSMDAIENGKVVNKAGSGFDLSMSGTPYLTNFAVTGTAMWFNGTASSYGTCAPGPALTNRTISFWMYRNPDPGPLFDPANRVNTMPTIFSGLSGQFLRMNNSWINADTNRRLADQSLVCYLGEGGVNNGWYYGFGNYPQFNIGAWTHVAITVASKSEAPDGGKTVYTFDARLYLNGEPYVVQSDCVISNICTSSTITLGNIGNHQRPFCGAIDEFRVFDTVLTPEQVREEFERAGDVCTARLVAWYPMQTITPADGGGYTTADMSGFDKTMAFTDHTTPVQTDVGGAIRFDGTATTRGVAQVPTLMQDLTVAMWLNVSTNATIVRISGQNNNFPWLFTIDATTIRFLKDLTSRKLQYTLRGLGSGTVNNLEPAYVGKGAWQHFVFVARWRYDESAGEMKTRGEVFVNGELAGTGSWQTAGTWMARDTTFALGAAGANGNQTRVFEGDVSDFRIYAGALTSNQVTRLYRSAAVVDAGSDFTVNGASAVLCGSVGSNSGEDYRRGYCGDVAWTLVSCPAGGDTATIARPGNPITEVSLPVEGAYVFRLSTATGFDAVSDVVTVTRDDSASSGQPSSGDAERLAAATQDAAAASTIANGLMRHWPFRSFTNPFTDVVASKTLTSVSVQTENLSGSPFGYALNLTDPTHGAGMGEKPETYDAETIPVDEWRTFSAWMYQDSELSARPHYAPCLLSARTTIWVMLNRYSNPKNDGLQQTPGLSIYQAGVKGVASVFFYPAPYSFTNRWTHVVAAINRHDSAKIEVWVDGVKQTASVSSVGKYNATSFNNGAHNGENAGGRSSENWWIGGIDYNAKDYSVQSNGIYSVAHDPSTDTFYSRTFPGKLADIRLYNRKLTEAEIAYLARHPGDGNLAPYIGDDVPGAGTMSVRRAKAFAPTVLDDGRPLSGGLTYEWEVVSGDPADVTFSDRTAATTQVTVAKVGTYSFRLKVSDGERVTYGKTVVSEVLQGGTVIMLK